MTATEILLGGTNALSGTVAASHGAIAFVGSARDLASRTESAMNLYLGF